LQDLRIDNESDEAINNMPETERAVLAVPSARSDLAFLFHAMRNEGLFDVESLNELLPGAVVDAEDGLVFLDFLLPLLVDCVWLTWYLIRSV
jgi:hypothetical protein